MLRHVSRLATVIVVFALGIGMGVGIMGVVAHGGDTDLIHGCVNPKSGGLRIVETDDTCRQNETALDWNQGHPGTARTGGTYGS